MVRVYLETERLVLRRFTVADADRLVELDGDPAVMRYLTGGAPTPRATIEGDILPAFLGYYARGDRYGFWAVHTKSDGAFLGWFHFRPERGGDPAVPVLGYRLRRAAWGRGYATEGSRALIDRGFAEFGVPRVIASTYQDNIASRRVMEKCGMRFVRAFHYTPDDLAGEEAFGADGAEAFAGEDVEYAIERADWERARRERR